MAFNSASLGYVHAMAHQVTPNLPARSCYSTRCVVVWLCSATALHVTVCVLLSNARLCLHVSARGRAKRGS